MPKHFRHLTGWIFFSCCLCMSLFRSVACTPTSTESSISDAAEKKSENLSERVVVDKQRPEHSSDRLPEVSPDTIRPHLPLDQPLESGETRVGQIKKGSERITGPEARSRIGDWRIYNEHVAFVIHGVGHSRFFSGGQGQLIDASPVAKDGSASKDLMEEVFSGFGVLRVVQATAIKVLEPGGPGKRAVLRISATDVGIPIIDVVLHSRPFDGKIEVDYILEPGAKHIEIITRLIGGERLVDQQMGDGILFGDQTRLIANGIGWKIKDAVRKPLEWFGAVGEGVSYLLTTSDPKGHLTIPITQAALFPAFGGLAKSDDDKSEYKRLLFVGNGSLEEMLKDLRTFRHSSSLKHYSGVVKGLSHLQRADIVLLDEKGVAISHTRPDAKGVFDFEASSGSYKLSATALGRTALLLPAKEGSSNTLSFAPGAALQLTIKEVSPGGSIGGFVPVRVNFTGTTSFRYELIDPATKIPVPPGSYTVTVSRGLSYEYWQKKLDFQPKDGNPVLLKEEIRLKKVVDTSGYIGADMHLHASPSLDSEYPIEQRVASFVTEGLHFVVATDHDRFTDYSPTVKKLKLSKWLKTAIGQEVSPLSYHFNAFPLKALPSDEPVYFAVKWASYENRKIKKTLEGPTIWAMLRKRYQVPIIQLNHPRGSQAFLSYIKYDPKKGMKAIPTTRFDTNWDSIELYNGSGRDTFLRETLLDWFSFLNQGMYKTGVGNSDSHVAGTRPGLPRTLIASSTQDGEKISIDEVMKNLKGNRAIIYGGPFIKLLVNKKPGPGARVSGPSLEMSIEISAPSWIPVSYVKLYANGKLERTFEVKPSKDPVRFKKILTLKPSQDTYYVVFAGDEKQSMSVVYNRKPVSMTNPVFLDIDGKGFTPPGLK